MMTPYRAAAVPDDSPEQERQRWLCALLGHRFERYEETTAQDRCILTHTCTMCDHTEVVRRSP